MSKVKKSTASSKTTEIKLKKNDTELEEDEIRADEQILEKDKQLKENKDSQVKKPLTFIQCFGEVFGSISALFAVGGGIQNVLVLLIGKKLCFVSGFIQILCSLIVLLLEWPSFFYPWRSYTRIVSKRVNNNLKGFRGLFYCYIATNPVVLCPSAESFLGCGLIFFTGLVYMAIAWCVKPWDDDDNNEYKSIVELEENPIDNLIETENTQPGANKSIQDETDADKTMLHIQKKELKSGEITLHNKPKDLNVETVTIHNEPREINIELQIKKAIKYEVPKEYDDSNVDLSISETIMVHKEPKKIYTERLFSEKMTVHNEPKQETSIRLRKGQKQITTQTLKTEKEIKSSSNLKQIETDKIETIRADITEQRKSIEALTPQTKLQPKEDIDKIQRNSKSITPNENVALTTTTTTTTATTTTTTTTTTNTSSADSETAENATSSRNVTESKETIQNSSEADTASVGYISDTEFEYKV